MQNRILLLMSDRRFILAMLSVAGLGLATGGVWLAYKHHATTRDSKAQLIFAEQLEQFEHIRMNPDATIEMWESIDQGFAQGYNTHSNASLAPYFLAYEADAALHVGNRNRAIELLEKAIKKMGAASPLYYLYAIKLGMIRLESCDRATSEQGRRDLLTYGQETRNPYQGLAWYQLWLYAWMAHDTELSSLAMTKLKAFAQWEHLAREKLGADASL
jgi:hypothetical protein